MICKNCGTELKDNAKFCTNCGEETGVVDHYITYYPPAVKKKAKSQLSSKNGSLISVIVGGIAVILVLLVAIFISEKDNLFKADEKKKTDDIIEEHEDPTPTQSVTETVKKHAEAKDKDVSATAISATITADGKINLSESATGNHVAVVTDENGSVTYYIPLRSYLTNEEGFDTWGTINEQNDWGANRRNNYDTGIVYMTIWPSIDLIISTEIIENDWIQHNYRTTIYSATSGNEMYVPIEALVELLGYGEVVYDADNSVIKFTAKAAQAVNPENPDEPVGEQKPENPAVNDELTDAELKAMEEEAARIKAEEEAARIKAEEEAARKKAAEEAASARKKAAEEAEADKNANDVTGNHVHTYGDWITITPATCTEDGTQIRECKTCATGRETQDIRAIGHIYGESVITQPATCTATGTKEQTCANCGHKKTDATPMLEHSYSEWVNTRDGYEIRTCTRCGYKKSRRAQASVHSHTWSSWVIENDSTKLCTQNRNEIRTCTTCGAQETRDSGFRGVHIEATAGSKICMICGEAINYIYSGR